MCAELYTRICIALILYSGFVKITTSALSNVDFVFIPVPKRSHFSPDEPLNSKVLLRPNPGSFFCKVERMRRKEYGRTYSETVSRRYTHRDACCNERTFIAPEYKSMSRKDAITLFSKSSAIVGPSFKSQKT